MSPAEGASTTAPATDVTPQDTGETLVRMADAGKRFGEDWVLRDLDLEVAPGTILGLIGPSGSGKTSTVRLMTGVYAPDEGDVAVFGVPPSRLSRRDRQRLGYLPQHAVLFRSMSLWENLQYHASLNGVRLRRQERLREMLDFVDLDGQERTLVEHASGGMQRRTALAAALLHRPDLLLLDEPTAGIDPILRRRFWERFRELRDDGRTLVVTTQYVGEAADCDVVALIVDGRVLRSGTPVDLRREAVGGELVEVETEAPVSGADRGALADVEGVLEDPTWVGPRRLRLLVEAAGAVAPRIHEALSARDHIVVDTSQVEVSWDDVFVRIVEDHGGDGASGQGSGRRLVRDGRSVGRRSHLSDAGDDADQEQDRG